MRKVQDIMTRQVVTVSEEDNMFAIRDRMEAYGLRHLPVVDGEKLVGLLTHRDMLRFADSQHGVDRIRQSIDDSRSEQAFVAAVMSRDLETVRPETPLDEAVQKLVAHKFGCLPVTTAEGMLVGIVTEHDFLKELGNMLKPNA